MINNFKSWGGLGEVGKNQVPSSSVSGLLVVCGSPAPLGGLGLRQTELHVVDHPVLVLVVVLEDRVDHLDQLVVLEDLRLGDRVPRSRVVVALVYGTVLFFCFVFCLIRETSKTGQVSQSTKS